MSLQRTTLRSVIDSSLCRRRQSRERIHAVKVKSWSGVQGPVPITVIEADVKGARLMFPFLVGQGETVSVSFEDALGQFQTRQARIAWTQPLGSSGKVVAGVAFNEELQAAA